MKSDNVILKIKEIKVILKSNNIVFYDGECPFCKSFVTISNVKKVYNDIKIVNAREYKNKFYTFLKYYDIDQGMIFIHNEKIYHGAEAFRKINQISRYHEITLLRWALSPFNNKIFTKVVYPFLRFGRNMTLRILMRKKIY